MSPKVMALVAGTVVFLAGSVAADDADPFIVGQDQAEDRFWRGAIHRRAF